MSDDTQLAQDVALDARSYLETLEAVASGEAGSQAISLLLLDVARICVAGAQLSPMTSPRSRVTSSTACGTSTPAGWRSRCGGGSSPTSTTGAGTPVRRCARC